MASSGSDGARMDRRAALLGLAVIGLALAAAGPARAPEPTYVAGELRECLWTAAGTPYVLVANTTVPAGCTLVIEAGVEVRANAGVGLQVLGGLAVLGTADQPVRFTANASSPAAGFWLGIHAMNPAGTVSLDHATVESADIGLAVVGGTATIAHSFLGTNARGIHVQAGEASVVETYFAANTQAGVSARDATLSVRAARFADNFVSMNLVATHAIVENSTFLAPVIGDLTLDAGSLAELRASPREGTVKFVDNLSRLDVQAILNVTVTDRYAAPLSGAEVLVEDNANGNATASALTGHEGRTPDLLVLEQRATMAGAVDFNPFTITATATGGSRGIVSVPVHLKTTVTVAVDADLTPPTPVFPRDLAVNQGASLTLDASASTDNDPSFPGSGTFVWSFPQLGLELFGVQATITFPVPGAYDGVLTAADGEGNSAILTFVVRVLDTRPPVLADVQVPAGGLVGETLVFDAMATDNDPAFSMGDAIVWRFSLGADAFERTGQRVEIAFDRPGTWTVTVTAADPTGNTASVERTVAIAAPPAPPSPWPWIGGGLAFLAAALGLATERGKVGLLTLFLPLYTRIKDDAVLDQFTRGQIYGYIRVHPGDTYTDIRRNLDLNNGTLTYHLHVLERQQMIRTVNRGAHKFVYPVDVRPAEDGGGLHELQQRILRVLHEAPGSAVSDLAAVLGISRQLAIYHARLLAQQGLVRLERRGLKLCGFATDRA